jgi:tRNA A37 N6-isopentenylltransferase MiaA
MDKLRKVIVISGMTGVGKTNIARLLSQHLNGELVSADSLQIYKGLDILSNKPSSSAAAASISTTPEAGMNGIGISASQRALLG